MPETLIPTQMPAAVAGLGLMGSSIAACLLAAGHTVVGLETSLSRRRSASRRLAGLLREMRQQNILQEDVDAVMQRLHVASSFDALAETKLVIEAVFENSSDKRNLLQQVEAVAPKSALIGCNTSAIPISYLQDGAINPKRILGIHWAEPAHITRFLEVIRGKQTSPTAARQVVALSRHWGKEPTLLQRDIRGFVANRCFYAMLREAMHLVENGYATVADVDRSLRNDIGYWITFAGPFRFIDLTGLPAYEAVARDLFPELANNTTVPPMLKKLADSGAKGTANQRGFYKYSKQQAERWDKLFHEFTYQVRSLASQYPENIGDQTRARVKPSGQEASHDKKLPARKTTRKKA